MFILHGQNFPPKAKLIKIGYHGNDNITFILKTPLNSVVTHFTCNMNFPVRLIHIIYKGKNWGCMLSLAKSIVNTMVVKIFKFIERERWNWIVENVSYQSENDEIGYLDNDNITLIFKAIGNLWQPILFAIWIFPLDSFIGFKRVKNWVCMLSLVISLVYDYDRKNI